jgi:hypothetical protein
VWIHRGLFPPLKALSPLRSITWTVSNRPRVGEVTRHPFGSELIEILSTEAVVTTAGANIEGREQFVALVDRSDRFRCGALSEQPNLGGWHHQGSPRFAHHPGHDLPAPIESRGDGQRNVENQRQEDDQPQECCPSRH